MPSKKFCQSLSADFNSDGKSDILFWDGAVYATWQLNDTVIIPGGGTLGSLGGDWRLVN